MSVVQFRGQGGAIARVPDDATAFAHRSQKYFVAPIALWEDADESPEPHEAWTSDLWDRISHEGSGAYVNFQQGGGEAPIRESYPPETLRRLRDVKTKYDPDNVFRFNQNIQPN
jgi:hypothetical protein